MPIRRYSSFIFRPTTPTARRRTAIRPGSIFRIRDEKGEYRLDHVLAQDAMAWETQGAPTDRTQEHLGVGDEGIILLRKILREQIDIVRNGGEPLGVVRDPQKESADRVRSDQRAHRDCSVKSRRWRERFESRTSELCLSHGVIRTAMPKNLKPEQTFTPFRIQFGSEDSFTNCSRVQEEHLMAVTADRAISSRSASTLIRFGRRSRGFRVFAVSSSRTSTQFPWSPGI